MQGKKGIMENKEGEEKANLRKYRGKKGENEGQKERRKTENKSSPFLLYKRFASNFFCGGGYSPLNTRGGGKYRIPEKCK